MLYPGVTGEILVFKSSPGAASLVMGTAQVGHKLVLQLSAGSCAAGEIEETLK